MTTRVGICPKGPYSELLPTSVFAVGKPIQLQKILNPSQEEVDKLH